MSDLISRLREHDDARLYREADVLMAEAADRIDALEAQLSAPVAAQERIAELEAALASCYCHTAEHLAEVLGQPAPAQESTPITIKELVKSVRAGQKWTVGDAAPVAAQEPKLTDGQVGTIRRYVERRLAEIPGDWHTAREELHAMLTLLDAVPAQPAPAQPNGKAPLDVSQPAPAQGERKPVESWPVCATLGCYGPTEKDSLFCIFHRDE